MARPKGSPNKATTTAREAFTALINGRLEELNAWIDRVAATDPARAFGMVMTLASYCVPRPRPDDPPMSPADVPKVEIVMVDPRPCTRCGHDPQAVTVS
jgi:hypothetical protein